MIKQTKWKNMDAISLENEKVRAVVLPSLGGKVASLKLVDSGFELCAQNSREAYDIPEFGSDFSHFDASGLDDAFPNIDPEEFKRGGKTFSYPDHGAVWSTSFDCRTEGNRLILSSRSPQFGYNYSKEFSLEENSLRISYCICNDSGTDLPCIWTFHGLMRYEEDMVFHFPGCVRDVLLLFDSKDFGTAGKVFPLTGPQFDFTRVPERSSLSMRKFYACDVVPEGRCSVTYPTQKVKCELEYDAEVLPYLGCWITAGGYRGDHNVALEPSNGYYDLVSRAEQNGKLCILKPEQSLEFSIGIALSGI